MGKVYPPEYRQQAVELYRLDESTTFADVAREMGCSSEAVRAWVRQADIDAGRRDDGPTSAERDELTELRRENRRLRKEREILKAAAAFFANEEMR